ncbi:MAG: M14 family zinc carboxypeptidase, partial [Bacteroidales bacterium]|nr:M14 family zinc carboxypeptidase [Bacteroidales bacterium]
MKKINFLIVTLLLSVFSYAQTDLSYYLPEDINYSASIPAPAEFAGHQIGDLHLTHDKIYFYMLRLAELSDRAIWEEYGISHEGRALGNLVISSSSNIRNIDNIRKKHISLSDPAVSTGLDISDMPVVVKLGYGVHGNESSAQNASVLIAYYLTAGNGDKIDELLNNTVILIDPSLNPDGLQRHSTWVNMYKSSRLNPDANSIEFKEAWPGGRTNHYWFDLNRDYIMLQHPESIGRVEAFHRWKPNIN